MSTYVPTHLYLWYNDHVRLMHDDDDQAAFDLLPKPNLLFLPSLFPSARTEDLHTCNHHSDKEGQRSGLPNDVIWTIVLSCDIITHFTQLLSLLLHPFPQNDRGNNCSKICNCIVCTWQPCFKYVPRKSWRREDRFLFERWIRFPVRFSLMFDLIRYHRAAAWEETETGILQRRNISPCQRKFAKPRCTRNLLAQTICIMQSNANLFHTTMHAISVNQFKWHGVNSSNLLSAVHFCLRCDS
jgi:hypothetical protein